MENQVLTIEQMLELEALSIDTSIASMFWYIKANPIINGWDEPELCMKKPLWLNIPNKVIPTFTLQDILDMLPKSIMHSNKQLKTCNYKLCTFDNKVMYTFNSFDQCWLKCTHGKNLLEAAFNMLKWCKQNKYI